MSQVVSLKGFLDEYGESMADKVTRDLTVVHDPAKHGEKALADILQMMTKKPFPAQAEIIKACYKSFVGGNKGMYLVAECGTGKTIQATAVAYLLHKLKGIHRVLVVCPPHLVQKWIKEIKDSLPQVTVYNFNGKDIITQLEIARQQPKPQDLEFYIVGRERVKTGYMWRPAVITRRQKHYCPKCGQELLDKDGCPVDIFEANSQGRPKKRRHCVNHITKWKYDPETGKHQKVEVECGEQLWQPDMTRKKLRKAIPAKFIKDKMPNAHELLIVDEAHQFKNESGQGYAFGALSSACEYVLCLTGTLIGGYSSDIFNLMFRTHPAIMLEDGNKWGNPKSFIERYGILERITTTKEEDGLTTKARKSTIIKEKPGISPLLLGRMLLSNAVFLRLADCMDHLQPYEEEVIELGMPGRMQALYTEFEGAMKSALLAALHKGDNSLLGAYLHALLSYPERMYKGVKVFHPRTKALVAVGEPLDGIQPKEHELVSIIKTELAEARKVLVYVENTNTTDITPRLTELLEAEEIRVKVLRSGDTENRAQIIDDWVAAGLDVLITNPKKVEVGLDLLDFPSIVFYQLPMSTYTLRQASRRSWRIPQTRPVKVYFLTYAETMQTRLMQLMADKLMTSLAV
ncbi:MAG: DEAD/DEAH box helicase, partial [Deltaproteobacteria bacterium]|nr:DEAD/DEAH box helicase [Deltaproteobacteria bacterium]